MSSEWFRGTEKLPGESGSLRAHRVEEPYFDVDLSFFALDLTARTMAMIRSTQPPIAIAEKKADKKPEKNGLEERYEPMAIRRIAPII